MRCTENQIMGSLRLSVHARRALRKTMVPLHFRQTLSRRLTIPTNNLRVNRDPHAKWEAEWKRRGGKEFTNAILNTEYESPHPLNPIYHRHLGMSILDTLKNLAQDSAPEFTMRNICENSIYDHPLVLGARHWGDPVPEGGSFKKDMGSYIREFGVDITRLYVIVKGERAESHPDAKAIRENLLQVEKLLARAWAATVIAHNSYVRSQPSRPSQLEIPAALYEPNLESWIDNLADEVPSYVHSPPDEWEIGRIYDIDHARLYLAMQNAIRSMTLPLDVQNTPLAVEEALRALAERIIHYDGSDDVYLNDHVESARVLLCLIAPLAPSFAEEAWRVLLEGPGVSNYTPKGADAILSEILREEENEGQPSSEGPEDNILEGTSWEKPDDDIHFGLPDLPIKGLPESICSVFDQAFPRRVSSLELNKLRQRVEREMAELA